MSAESGFGPWLRRKLLERHMSLAQLCRTAGCDYTYLWRIIHSETARGRKYTRPSYDLTLRVGEALGAAREALVAAGYEKEASLAEARTADRLARMERDLAEIRAALEPAETGSPSEWKTRRLPLLGFVRGGELHEALENPGEWIELPEFLTGEGGFALRVRGDSMAPTLMEGDVVTVREQAEAEPGQVVVAMVADEVTLKRLEVLDGIPTLIADNPDWEPVRCGPRVRIVGIVTGSYRPPEVLRRRPG